MERIEEEMQVEKIADLKYIAFLLEKIAYQTGKQYLELSEYTRNLRSEYASYVPSPTGILRDMRTRSTARQGEVPKHVEGQDVGVRINTAIVATNAQNLQSKK